MRCLIAQYIFLMARNWFSILWLLMFICSEIIGWSSPIRYFQIITSCLVGYCCVSLSNIKVSVIPFILVVLLTSFISLLRWNDELFILTTVRSSPRPAWVNQGYWIQNELSYHLVTARKCSHSDMSLLGLYPCSNISAPTSLSITSATFCSVLSIVAVVGNILVFLAVIIDPNRNLRSPFNWLVANLAAADLIVGCFALPLSAEFYIREASTEQLTLLPRDDARRVGSFISCTASLFSLAAMSVDRFFAITNPMEYRAKLNSRRAIVILFSIWIISIGLPFLYFSVGYLKYQFFFAITAVVTTFVVLCLTYVKVFKSFKNQVKTWDSLNQGSASYNHVKKRTIKWEKKVTKTFLIMLTLFISCFLPSLLLILIISFCASCNCDFIHWARDLNYILIMANSSMNPFVFAWRLQSYRDAFLKILTCGVIARKLRSVSEQINISMNSLNPSSWISSSIQNW